LRDWKKKKNKNMPLPDGGSSEHDICWPCQKLQKVGILTCLGHGMAGNFFERRLEPRLCRALAAAFIRQACPNRRPFDRPPRKLLRSIEASPARCWPQSRPVALRAGLQLGRPRRTSRKFDFSLTRDAASCICSLARALYGRRWPRSGKANTSTAHTNARLTPGEPTHVPFPAGAGLLPRKIALGCGPMTFCPPATKPCSVTRRKFRNFQKPPPAGKLATVSPGCKKRSAIESFRRPAVSSRFGRQCRRVFSPPWSHSADGSIISIAAGADWSSGFAPSGRQ